MKKVNEIFGYTFFFVGAVKILVVILGMIQIGTNMSAIFSGENVDYTDYSNITMAIFIFLIISFWYKI